MLNVIVVMAVVVVMIALMISLLLRLATFILKMRSCEETGVHCCHFSFFFQTTGICSCKENATGMKCDKCEEGLYDVSKGCLGKFSCFKFDLSPCSGVCADIFVSTNIYGVLT